MLHEGNRARRERQVWRSGVGFLLLSVILNTHISTFVRSRTGDANRSASLRLGIHGHPWVARSSVASSLDRHSRATERAAFGSRRRNRFGSVRFLIFLRRVRSRRTDGRTERRIAEEGFKTRIVDQFILGFVLATDRFDPIRSDPTRSFASPVRSERCRTATRVGFTSTR